MQIYKLVGDSESIRAFAAAQTHKRSRSEVRDFSVYLQEEVPPMQ